MRTKSSRIEISIGTVKSIRLYEDVYEYALRMSLSMGLSMSLSKANEPFEKALQGQDVCVPCGCQDSCNDIFEPAWIPSLGRCSGQGFRRELCQLGMLCTIRAIHDTRHGLKLDIDAARE